MLYCLTFRHVSSHQLYLPASLDIHNSTDCSSVRVSNDLTITAAFRHEQILNIISRVNAGSQTHLMSKVCLEYLIRSG